MRSFLLSLLFILLAARAAPAQRPLDTVRATIGKSAFAPFRWSGRFADLPSPVTVSGGFHLSNSTVFYPERFTLPDGDTLVESKLTRLTDSTYTFTLTIRPARTSRPGRDTLFLLGGETLAGSDSLSRISFNGVSLAGEPTAGADVIFISASIGSRPPYVRFATLEQNYPNPVPVGSGTTWAFRIDKASRVIFRIYDMSLREMVYADLGEQPIGIHTWTLADASILSNGAYVVRMTTNSGEAHRFMHVVR